MEFTKYRNGILMALMVTGSFVNAVCQPKQTAVSSSISANTLLKIVRSEDQRNWNDELKTLLSDKDARVRARAALAAGRIGEQEGVPSLSEMLLTDRDVDVRAMAAFALGEIELPSGGYALVQVLKNERANFAARA